MINVYSARRLLFSIFIFCSKLCEENYTFIFTSACQITLSYCSFCTRVISQSHNARFYDNFKCSIFAFLFMAISVII